MSSISRGPAAGPEGRLDRSSGTAGGETRAAGGEIRAAARARCAAGVMNAQIHLSSPSVRPSVRPYFRKYIFEKSAFRVDNVTGPITGQNAGPDLDWGRPEGEEDLPRPAAPRLACTNKIISYYIILYYIILYYIVLYFVI